MITPSPATNNEWVMLFNTNLQETFPTAEAIYMVTSSNGTTPSGTPQIILQNTPANVCDMADARPMWDGANWHVYVQAVGWSGSTCADVAAFVVEASGPTLTQLSWVLDPGTNNATEIIQCNCTSGPGIGEGQQWFNTGPYGAHGSTPYMLLYNNWAYQQGIEVFSYLTNFTEYNYFYQILPPNSQFPAGTRDLDPDVILDTPFGSSSGTNFGLGIGDVCSSGQNYYYMNSLAFYPNIVPPAGGTAENGIGISYAINSVSSDGNGQRGFAPRFARNQYGYLDLTNTGPNTWTTYVYYDDAESANCNFNAAYKAGADRFSVSQVTFTQFGSAAYWNLDEPAGATSFADSSGNGNTGTCSGSGCPTMGVAGKVGTAARFNGTTNQITVPDSPSLRLNQFTIALWVYPTEEQTNYQPLVVKEDSAGNNRNYGLYIYPSSMQVRYSAWKSDCATKLAATSTGQLTLNAWNHVAFTYDGTTETLYLNGALDSSYAASSPALCQAAVPVKLGMENSAFMPFSGMLDDVQIFNQALTASEVSNLYNIL